MQTIQRKMAVTLRRTAKLEGHRSTVAIREAETFQNEFRVLEMHIVTAKNEINATTYDCDGLLVGALQEK